MENQKASGMLQVLRGLRRGRLESKPTGPKGHQGNFPRWLLCSDPVKDWKVIPTGTDSLIFKAWLFEASS